MERQNRNNQRIKQDKVNDQPDGQPADNLPSNRLVALTQSRALKWIVSVLIFMAIFLHYRQLPLPKQMPVSQHDQMQAVKPVKHNCQSMPPHGTVYAIDPSVMQRTDVLYSGLQIINQHDHAMVAVLSPMATHETDRSPIGLPARKADRSRTRRAPSPWGSTRRP